MKNPIKAVIIENEEAASTYLSSIIKENFNEISIKASSKTVTDGVKLINNLKPELVFLDIELDDGTAFDLLEKLNHHDFEVIFTTAFNTYHERALEHFAFCYLMKPINADELKTVINRYQQVKNRLFSLKKYSVYQEFIRNSDSRLLLHTGDSHIAVNLSDIVLCEADGNYTNFKLVDNKSILASNTLKYYEDLLSYKAFFRANRFCLINIKHINNIHKKETIILSNQDRVNVSVRNKSKLTELISNLS